MTLSSTLIESVKSAKSVAIIGNGGNLAIANHVGSDMNRYLGKFTFYPDAVHLTALSQDRPWHKPWIRYASQNADVIIGITTRVKSPIADALAELPDHYDCFLFCPEEHPTVPTVVIDRDNMSEFFCLDKACLSQFRQTEDSMNLSTFFILVKFR